MVDAVNGINTGKIDLSKWKKLTPQEVIKQAKDEEQVPPEVLAWAQQMAAFANIPDDITYEQVDGDVGIDALNKLGIEDNLNPEIENAEKPTETEEPDAVKDPAKAQETEMQENPQIGQVGDMKPDSKPEKESDNQVFTLADTSLTADQNEIRKRKERKGIL